MKIKGLHQECDFYWGKLDIYEQFSNAEDYPSLIPNYLKIKCVNKSVLDAGCSFAKILKVLTPFAGHITGVDQSSLAIERAQELLNGGRNVSLSCNNLEDLKFADRSFQLIYASWVLGTILDIEKRNKALQELQRVSANDGEIYLFENAAYGEFEWIRGRDTADQRTIAYNDWISSKGFVLLEVLETYFQFSSLESAKEVVSQIWGEDAAKRVKSARICHPVSVYKLQIAK